MHFQVVLYTHDCSCIFVVGSNVFEGSEAFLILSNPLLTQRDSDVLADAVDGVGHSRCMLLMQCC